MRLDDRVSSAVLIWVVVSLGQGSKAMRLARQCGIKGGTVFLGTESVDNRVWSFLGISDVETEIVLLAADGVAADHVLEVLRKELHFERPNRGLAFTTSICHVAGTRLLQCDETAEEGGVVEAVYQLVTVIVDKGKAGQVIDAATQAGSRGGTVVQARGSGIHETRKVFSVDIEPEKEIVLILCTREKTDHIVATVREQLQLDVPGNGIIFTQNVDQAYGLSE